MSCFSDHKVCEHQKQKETFGLVPLISFLSVYSFKPEAREHSNVSVLWAKTVDITSCKKHLIGRLMGKKVISGYGRRLLEGKCTFSTVIVGKRDSYVDMEIPRNPVSLTVSRMLELNQHLVLAIYNPTFSS